MMAFLRKESKGEKKKKKENVTFFNKQEDCFEILKIKETILEFN